MKFAVECAAVEKKFGNFTAVDKVDLKIPEGQCFGLLGPNGAGKSTLISLLYGALYRTSGSVRVLGMDPQTEAQTLRARMGIVTQENNLDMSMSVRENMVLYAGFQGVEKSVSSARIDELLDFMLLSHKQSAVIESLSGGMKRRLVFVRALLNNPEIVILDEPTTGLDPAVRQLLWDKINEIKKRGVTVLLTTHYMDEAERLCDQLVIMHQGRIVEHGAPQRLIEKYCPRYVAGLLKSTILKTDFPDVTISEDPQHKLVWHNSLENLSRVLTAANVVPQFIRPANLEDVFLKVTGTELAEND